MNLKFTRTGVVLVVVALLAAGCTAFTQSQDDSSGGDLAPEVAADADSDAATNTPDADIPDPDRPLRIVSVQHARCDWDSFWCPVADGQNDAVADLGVEHELLAPDSFDIDAVTALIEEAIASQPDGLAVTIPDADALRAPIQAAVDAGIPVVAYNAGNDPATDQIGYLTFLGQDEFAGGLRGGERLLEAGGRGTGVCINQQIGSRSLDQRCAGFEEALIAAGSSVKVLEVDEDRAASTAAIVDFVESNPEVDMFLTLGPNASIPFYDAVEAGSLTAGNYLHGTFDVGDDVREAIRDGRTLFGIDQQPYLQGYNSIATLTNLLRFGLAPALPVTVTGPGFVTADSVERTADADGPLRIVSVQHAACDWDAFWCPVATGQQAAVDALGVEHTLLAPDEFDVAKVAELVGSAVEMQPDGIAVTIPDISTMREPIQAAIDAGIPVVAYNAGDGPEIDDLGYLTFLGQDEYAGGFQSGERLVAAGGSQRGVCVNQQVGVRSIDLRCNGFSDALNEAGVPVSILETDESREESAAVIAAFVAAFPETDIFLTGGPNAAFAFYEFVETEGRDDASFVHGTFDLGPEIVANIRSGRTIFGVDQQPFLQGYWSITTLVQLLRRGVVPAAPVSPTGPGFVTLDNLDLVEALAGEYR